MMAEACNDKKRTCPQRRATGTRSVLQGLPLAQATVPTTRLLAPASGEATNGRRHKEERRPMPRTEGHKKAAGKAMHKVIWTG